jgi:hypothetical protein
MNNILSKADTMRISNNVARCIYNDAKKNSIKDENIEQLFTRVQTSPQTQKEIIG